MGLSGLLPAEVSAALDWESVQVVQTSFVDPSLAAKEADILYAVKRHEKDAYLYVLLEHQSTQPKWMMLRMAGYMARIHEHHLAMHPDVDKLPVVVPVVLYQGAEHWTRSTRYADYFDVEGAEKAAFSRYVPGFECEIISLPAMLEGDIQGDPYFEATMRLMKALREKGAIEQCLEAIEAALTIICTEREDPDFVIAAFHYALHADDIDFQAVRDKFSSIQNTQLKKTAMTAAEQLMEQGAFKRSQDDVIDVLEVRFEAVPEGLQEVIRGIFDDTKLRSLLRTAVTCQSIEDFTKAL